MKSHDAFALRGFDAEQILQRNFFLQQLGIVHDDSDENTLDLMDARNVDFRGSAEMVIRLKDLQKLKTAVAAYTKLLDVHIRRLESISTYYARKFMDTAAPTWQEKYRRAQKLQQAYNDAADKLSVLQKKINELERAGDKALDEQRRKEFANRLKAARQKAGLKQSEVAAQVKVTTATIASYEQAISAPQIPMLIRLAQILNASADELLGLKTG